MIHLNKNIVLQVVKEILLEAKEGLVTHPEKTYQAQRKLSNHAYEPQPIKYQASPCLKKNRKN